VSSAVNNNLLLEHGESLVRSLTTEPTKHQKPNQ
jgi:hypothetical protein